MESPQFRASWSKFVLRCAKRMKDPTGALIADTVPDDLRREIREVGQPLISPLVRGALAAWGSSPGSLVRRSPEAWIFFTRYCGTIRAVATEEPNSMVLRFENLAPICRSPSFLHMVEGGLESELDYLRASGTVETCADRFSTDGFVDIVVRW
jgi:hypothetical protein